jgi:hypothetical protein
MALTDTLNNDTLKYQIDPLETQRPTTPTASPTSLLGTQPTEVPTVESGGLTLPSTTVPTPEARMGSSFITPEATVQSQLASILQQGSPLQTLAEARSKEEAQRKGLLSSSMAVGAGQRALYESALPIAQQDAQLFGQAGLTQQQQQGQLEQTGFEGDITAQLTGTQGKVSEALQSQQIASAERLTEFKESEAGKRLTQELSTDLKMSDDQIAARLQETQMQINANLEITDKEIEGRLTEVSAKLDFDQRSQLIASIEPLTSGYNNAIAAIQTTPDNQLSPADKTRYMQYMKDQYMSQVDLFSSVYGTEIDWDLGATTLSTPATAPVTTPSFTPASVPTTPETTSNLLFNPVFLRRFKKI